MTGKNNYIFKIANRDTEFSQLHRLNYETFVEEIPQHQRNVDKMLIDRFHEQNTYLICIKEGKVIGMLAVRDKRPFSLDDKIGIVEESLPISTKNICELRLLAVAKEYRKGRVFLGMSQLLADYCLQKGYDAAVISGTTRELKLYRQLGFLPFANLTGKGEALFQPMYLSKAVFEEILMDKLTKRTLNFIPGPVHVSGSVLQSAAQPPISHRSETFKSKIQEVQRVLKRLTNSKYVQVMLGSGTLANDMISAQLSLLDGKGIILVNGEFSNRLTEHAERFGLNYVVLQKQWGEGFTYEELSSEINSDIKWIWAVHNETSTGVLNDINQLKRIAIDNDSKLCLDCISSIGGIEVDLSGVYLASGVSGKAIGALTGLSFVFHHHKVTSSTKLPMYLDLGLFAENNSISFSHSSNLIEALYTSLKKLDNDKYEKIAQINKMIREEMENLYVNVVSERKDSSPIILTVELPTYISSTYIGDTMRYNGFLIHYESKYLKERNWIQFACISTHEPDAVLSMLSMFKEILKYERSKLNQ